MGAVDGADAAELWQVAARAAAAQAGEASLAVTPTGGPHESAMQSIGWFSHKPTPLSTVRSNLGGRDRGRERAGDGFA